MKGVSTLVSADVVWFLAFTLAGALNIIYAAAMITR